MARMVSGTPCIGGLLGYLLVSLAIGPGEAAPNKETSPMQAPYGAYLAGRHAQQMRDYAAAVGWFEDALRADPESPELITRTFLMETSEGHFDRARSLAESELKLDPS